MILNGTITPPPPDPSLPNHRTIFQTEISQQQQKTKKSTRLHLTVEELQEVGHRRQQEEHNRMNGSRTREPVGGIYKMVMSGRRPVAMDSSRSLLVLLVVATSSVLLTWAAPDRIFDYYDKIVFREPTPQQYGQAGRALSTKNDTSGVVIENEYIKNNFAGERQGRVTYEGAQVWKVSIDSRDKIIVVGNLTRHQDVAAWGGDHSAIDFMIKPHNIQKISNILRTNGIPYEVTIPDLQQYIDNENPPLSDEEQGLQDRKARAYKFWNSYRIKGHVAMPVVKPASRRMAMLGAYMGYNSLDDHMEYWPTANWGHRLTWKQYHRLSDIHGFLDYLAVTYPAICSVQSIGNSHEGRPLKVLRISNGRNNKAVWIDGGIHAREWISPATVTYIINQFVEDYDNESDLIQNIDWYFLPVVNPDGYEYTHTIDRLWRKNRKGYGTCSGVDLNRNFGHHWGGQGTSKNPCSEVYAGDKAFSEPESQAISNFIMRSTANFKLYVSYHSYGQYILYPWGYDKVVPPDHADLDRVGKKAAQAIQNNGGSSYRVGASSIILYPAAGGSDDWAKAVGGIKYSYTVELSDTGRYGFILPASYITKVAKESIAALRVMAEAASAA